ncbi:MAG: BON domain-containing protein [Acidobacteriota bacterium]
MGAASLGSGHRLLSLAVAAAVGLCVSACAARPPVGSNPRDLDAWITAEVTRVLAKESMVNVEDLHVETRDGVVVLSGVQASLEKVSRAIERAARVRGVRQVINQIRVVQQPGGTEQLRGPLPRSLHDPLRYSG